MKLGVRRLGRFSIAIELIYGASDVVRRKRLTISHIAGSHNLTSATSAKWRCGENGVDAQRKNQRSDCRKTLKHGNLQMGRIVPVLEVDKTANARKCQIRCQDNKPSRQQQVKVATNRTDKDNEDTQHHYCDPKISLDEHRQKLGKHFFLHCKAIVFNQHLFAGECKSAEAMLVDACIDIVYDADTDQLSWVKQQEA